MKEFAAPLVNSWGRRFVWGLFFLLSQSVAVLGVSSITGSVRNESRGLWSVNDDVILLRIDENIQEEARAKTDAHGQFRFDLKYPERSYLVRVMHQGVSYDLRAPAGESLSIQVFDTAPKVEGLTGSIEILRVGANGDSLHVSDMYEVTNDSNPPMAQAGQRTFEVYLPAKATIDSVLAAGPDRIATMISAYRVANEPGHYTLSFPLRPGLTKFAFNYDVPYRDRAVFQTKLAYPMQQLAVMLSPSMKFSSPSSAFETLATENTDYRVNAANQLKAGLGPLFVISGGGAFPSLGEEAKSQMLSLPWAAPGSAKSIARAATSTSMRSAAPPLLHPLAYTRPSSQSSPLFLVSVALFAISGLWVWRVRRARPTSNARTC